MRSKFIIGLLIVFVLVVVFGTIHQNKKSNEMRVNAQETAARLELEKEQAKQKLINEFNPEKNKDVTIAQFLKYKELTKNQVGVSVVGSRSTKGNGTTAEEKNWFGILQKKITTNNEDYKLDRKLIKSTNHGFGGYSIVGLVNDDLFSQVTAKNPDLIIFESPAITSHSQNIPMEDTLNAFKEGYKQMKKELPDSVIVVMSPNPSTAKKTEKNNLDLTYQDYIDGIGNLAKKEKWLYFDANTAIQKQLDKEEIALYTVLTADGIYPNDQGYKIWGDEIFNYIVNTKVKN